MSACFKLPSPMLQVVSALKTKWVHVKKVQDKCPENQGGQTLKQIENRQLNLCLHSSSRRKEQSWFY